MVLHIDGSAGFRVLRSLVALYAIALLSGSPAGAATLPTGFSESLVASGLSNPTAMALAPDGRIFVCEQGGNLRVISGGSLLPTPFVTLTVNSSNERGLLGVAFDPAFATNQFVYVYYTATTPSIHNRVSRFTANGNVAVVGSEVELVNLETLSAGNHNGGGIHFGLDGKLYIAVGENAVGSNSQTLSNRLGKMLRINANGTIPSDNPFYNTATGDNRSIWALGLRNPFTFAVQPFTGRLFINDVGASTWEEINMGVAGANYGWPTTEGPTGDSRFRSPIYAYNHSSGCAISGGAFYTPFTTRFPTQYSGVYFFADLCGGWIRWRTDAGTVGTFATDISNPVDLAVSDDGRLYYLARGVGSVYRVDYTGAPIVTTLVNGSHGPFTFAPGSPLSVTYSFNPGSVGTLNPAELYFGILTQWGAFWMNPDLQTFSLSPTPISSGPMSASGPTTILSLPSIAGIPPGEILFVVAVDNDSNGILNVQRYDIVRTRVP